MRAPIKPRKPSKNAVFTPTLQSDRYVLVIDVNTEKLHLISDKDYDSDNLPESLHYEDLAQFEFSKLYFDQLISFIWGITSQNLDYELGFNRDYHEWTLCITKNKDKEVIDKELNDFNNRFEIYEKELEEYNQKLKDYNDFKKSKKIENLKSELQKLESQ